MNTPTKLVDVNNDILDCFLSYLNPIDYLSFACSFSYIFKMFKSRRCSQYSIVGTLQPNGEYIADKYIYNVLEYIAREGTRNKQEEIRFKFGLLLKLERIRIKELITMNGMIWFYLMIYPLVVPIDYKGPDPNGIVLSNKLIHEIVVRDYREFLTDEKINNYPIEKEYNSTSIYNKLCIECILNNKQEFWRLLGVNRDEDEQSFGYYARKQSDPFWRLKYPRILGLDCYMCKGELVDSGENMSLLIKTQDSYKVVYQIDCDGQDVYCPECDYCYMRCDKCGSINAKLDHIRPYKCNHSYSGCLCKPVLITDSEYDKLKLYPYGGPRSLLEVACGSSGGQELVWKCGDCHTEFVTTDK